MARKSMTMEKMVAEVAPTPPTDPQNAPLTRKYQLLALLGQEGGCTLAAISDVFGWKPHTTRAAIAGLRKAGHSIETTAGEGGTGYRIVSAGATKPQPAAGGR